jgi:hypothetical protein
VREVLQLCKDHFLFFFRDGWSEVVSLSLRCEERAERLFGDGREGREKDGEALRQATCLVWLQRACPDYSQKV